MRRLRRLVRVMSKRDTDLSSLSSGASTILDVTEPCCREANTTKGPGPRNDPAVGLSTSVNFEFFFLTERPRLESYCRQTVDPEEAREIAQEAFARLCAVSDPVESPTGLLYQIARNLVADHHRSRLRFALDPLDDAADFAADDRLTAEDQLCLQEEVDAAERMIASMPTRRKAIFVLRVLEHRAYSEIASELNVSLRIVKKELAKAYAHCAKHASAVGLKGERRTLRPPRNRTRP